MTKSGSACNNINLIVLFPLMLSSTCPCQANLASGSLVNRHRHQCSSALKFLHTHFKVAQVSLCRSYCLIKNKRRSNWSTPEPFHTEMHVCYRDAFAVNCHELGLMYILFKKTQLNYADFMCSAIRNFGFYYEQYFGDVTSKRVSLLLSEFYRFPSSNLKSSWLMIFIYCRYKPIY
jgi:hypothetical protein